MDYIILENEKMNKSDGIGTYVNQLIRFFREFGNRVHVAYIDSEETELKITYDSNDNLDMRIPKVENDKETVVKSIMLLRAELPLDRKYCIIINRQPFNILFDTFSIYFPKDYKISVVHNQFWTAFNNGEFSKFAKIYSDVLKVRLGDANPTRESDQFESDCSVFQKSHLVITLNEATYDLINKYYRPCNFCLIKNGLPQFESFNETDLIKIRSRYGFSIEDKIFLFVGRLSKIKGFDDLLKALDKIDPEDPKFNNMRIILAGSPMGSEYDYSKYAKWLRFFGHVTQDTIKDLIKISSAGLVLSRTEQSSYSVIQMQSAKLPLIISKNWGISTMIPDQAFTIQEGNNPDEIYKAIEAFLRIDPEDAIALSESSYENYLENFIEDLMKSKYEKVDKLIKSLEYEQSISVHGSL